MAHCLLQSANSELAKKFLGMIPMIMPDVFWRDAAQDGEVGGAATSNDQQGNAETRTSKKLMFEAAHVAFELYDRYLLKVSDIMNPASDCATWMQESDIQSIVQNRYPLMYDYIVTGESVIAQFTQMVADDGG